MTVAEIGMSVYRERGASRLLQIGAGVGWLGVRYGARLRHAAAPILLLLSCLKPDIALALGQECMLSYYRNPSQACIDGILLDFRQNPRADPNTLTGFLAELFRDSPEERDRILKAETADLMKSVDLASLWLAGLTDEARKFAEATNRSGLIEQARQTFPETLDAVRPSTLARDNDLLIGAYMASGNTDFIKRVLANYSNADDGMVADALRIGFMMGKFGPNIKPPGRTPATLQIACEKYQCKVERTKFVRLLTLASAIWAIQSLSQQDDGIRKTLNSFFASDQRLKTLFVIEQTAFGNYIMAIAGAAGFKSAQGDDQQRVYAAFDQAASIYEKFGSGSDALAPLQSLKK
jgi:hypothetical protein